MKNAERINYRNRINFAKKLKRVIKIFIARCAQIAYTAVRVIIIVDCGVLGHDDVESH